MSVTYEPFMYLSVPLPHAMERQICKLNHSVLSTLFIQKHFVMLDRMIGFLCVYCYVIINALNIFNADLNAILFLTWCLYIASHSISLYYPVSLGGRTLTDMLYCRSVGTL